MEFSFLSDNFQIRASPEEFVGEFDIVDELAGSEKKFYFGNSNIAHHKVDIELSDKCFYFSSH